MSGQSTFVWTCWKQVLKEKIFAVFVHFQQTAKISILIFKEFGTKICSTSLWQFHIRSPCCYLYRPYMMKYWRSKILANGSRFAKILPNQKLPLKCLNIQGDPPINYRQKFGKYYILSAKFHPSNISLCMVNLLCTTLLFLHYYINGL